MTYLGYTVLLLNPNRKENLEETVTRKLAILDTVSGIRKSDEHAAGPNPVRPFIWTAIGRPAVAELFAFLDERKGARVPFWFPSWQWDLALYSDLAATDGTAEINWVRYTQQMFPNTGARRHLAFYPLGVGGETVPIDIYKVTDANDPADFQTETLTISPAASKLYPAATTVISFLKLVRLEEDGITIKGGFDRAEATIQVRELPEEAAT